MGAIRIREQLASQDGSNTTVSFDDGSEYPITIRDPFSEEEEQLLEWYFEQWLRFPFTRQVDAQKAAASIATYGEHLFGQVFADPEAYARYKEALQAGPHTLHFEIAGSPAFHRWHWEALKDPKLPQPLALSATMVRRNLVPQVVRARVQPSPTINLLVITARPSGKHDVGYRMISRPLVEALRQADLRVQIDLVRPGTYRALVNHLEEFTAQHQNSGETGGYYHVIHFDVHGALLLYDVYQQLQQTYKGDHVLLESPYGHTPLAAYEGRKAFLFLEGEQDGAADPVEARQLADLLLQYQIPIAILNACQSGKQAGASEASLGSRLMQAGVQMVLAMGYSVTASAAELLMRTLYRQLFDRQDLSTAIRRARLELYNRKARHVYFNQTIELEDWLLPVVYQNQAQRLQVREFTPEESKAYYEGQAQSYAPRQPSYGFVGRDLDILQIEKRLLTKRNIVLIRGMGGAGKTTLLQHLGSWWQTTGLVKQVFYFGYDEKAWTRQQLMHTIAQRLLSPVEYVRDFQPLGLDAQQVMLTRRLRSHRHLVILDNLESITGEHLAIQHTLPQDEQDALRRFLVDFAGGQTLVLLGSRSGEDWLARETFEDNVYELGGLDPEAASTLAERILERHNATKYRQDTDLLKLLTLLDGFPLALEVVLANLARQTPTEVLNALQAGDVALDKGDAQEKTESILRCIDYSHSNLSPEAQQLLLCLAPFTSVFDLGILKQYTTHLQQQPALATLPFERWPEVLQEAANWGLLSPDPDLSRFLRLQPTLPYFLRSRLYAPEQREARRAVETAFRELYDQVGGMLYQLLASKDPQERQVGQFLTGLEYENLAHALNLALEAQASIEGPYHALMEYLDSTQDKRRGLELFQSALGRLERYSPEQLAGPLGVELVRLIGTIANWQRDLKEYRAAEASYQKLLEVVLQLQRIDEKGKSQLQATAYHNLGIVAQEQRHFEQAEQYYQQALQLKIEYHDRYAQASTYHQLGMVAQEQRKFEQAEQYYQQALQICIDFQDRYNQARIYHNLGMVAQEQRKFEQAEQYYQQALQIFIEYHDRYNQASTYHQLGRVAQEQREFQQAEQYYQQALQFFIEYGDRYEQASTYHQLGKVAFEQGQWQQAEQYYQQAEQIYIEYHDRYEQASTYHQLGRVAQEQRQWQQAEQYYQQALQICIEYQDRYEQADIYHQLGIVAQEQRQWDKAREYFLRALETYIAYQDDHNRGIVLRSLARLWRASGDTGLPTTIGARLNITAAEAEGLLREMVRDTPGERNG